jgi:hypothetical protein
VLSPRGAADLHPVRAQSSSILVWRELPRTGGANSRRRPSTSARASHPKGSSSRRSSAQARRCNCFSDSLNRSPRAANTISFTRSVGCHDADRIGEARTHTTDVGTVQGVAGVHVDGEDAVRRECREAVVVEALRAQRAGLAADVEAVHHQQVEGFVVPRDPVGAVRAQDFQSFVIGRECGSGRAARSRRAISRRPRSAPRAGGDDST